MGGISFYRFGHHPPPAVVGSLRSGARCSLGPADSLAYARDPLRIADAYPEKTAF